MKRALPSVLALAALMGPGAIVRAASSACERPVDPLLTVAMSREARVRALRLPPPPIRETSVLTISKGGAAALQQTVIQLCCYQTKSQWLATAILPATTMQTLQGALAAATVRVAADCVIENDLTSPTGVDFYGVEEVTWFGARGATNHFTVTFADPGASPLPRCSAAIANLLHATQLDADSVRRHDASIGCGSPL